MAHPAEGEGDQSHGTGGTLVLRAFLEGIPPRPGQEGIAHVDSFTSPARQAIFTTFLRMVQEGTYKDPRDLFPHLDDAGAGELTGILTLNVEKGTLPSILADCLRRLQIAPWTGSTKNTANWRKNMKKREMKKFLQELAECRRIKMEIGKLTKPA